MGDDLNYHQVRSSHEMPFESATCLATPKMHTPTPPNRQRGKGGWL